MVPIILWIDKLANINSQQTKHIIEKDIVSTMDKIIQKDSIKGIDISHYQGAIDWKKIKDIDFIIVKATGGTDYIDPNFYKNFDSIRSLGITRGVYHFYYASDDAIFQAEHFISTIGNLKPHDLPPILDIEILDNTSVKDMLKGIKKWLSLVESKTKKRPIIYSSISFYKEYLNDKELQKYPIWIAEYSHIDIKKINQKLPNKDIVLWQYTQHGKVDGISGYVDKSIFYSDKNSFNKFIKDSNKR
jgi:lysozyme